MTTFSAAKDSQDKKKSSMEDTDKLGKGLAEIGKRLLNLLAKIGCPMQAYDGQAWSFPLIKDAIYDLDEKF